MVQCLKFPDRDLIYKEEIEVKGGRDASRTVTEVFSLAPARMVVIADLNPGVYCRSLRMMAPMVIRAMKATMKRRRKMANPRRRALRESA
jgi:hypothetical protein